MKTLVCLQILKTKASSIHRKLKAATRLKKNPNGLTRNTFYILLTVHHVMILDKRPTWRTILFYVFIYIFNSLHVSSTSCSSSGETNCVSTTSGSCHSVGGRVVCRTDLHTTRPPTQKRVVRHVGHLSRIITRFTVNKIYNFLFRSLHKNGSGEYGS